MLSDNEAREWNPGRKLKLSMILGFAAVEVSLSSLVCNLRSCNLYNLCLNMSSRQPRYGIAERIFHLPSWEAMKREEVVLGTTVTIPSVDRESSSRGQCSSLVPSPLIVVLREGRSHSNTNPIQPLHSVSNQHCHE